MRKVLDGTPHLGPGVATTRPPAQDDFAATPEAALDAVRAFDGPILLDLDETLYLRSSTEDFIDSAWPRPLAFLLIRLLESLAPWRWAGGGHVRDNFRVGLVLLLFPWTRLIWRRRVAGLAAAHGNAALLHAARSRSEVHVVTNGFRPVVIPLLRALGITDHAVVAARVVPFADRRKGKLCLALAHLGPDHVASSLVVTDSMDDLSLLARARRGQHTVWQDAGFRPAFANLYYPGRYLSTVKRPGAGYVRKLILQDDLVLWLLCTAGFAAAPLSHLAALSMLMLSFWSVYEQGYVDNDIVGRDREADPKLSAEFHTSELVRRGWEPWLWAALSGTAGIYLLHAPSAPDPTLLAGWLAVLAGTHACFFIFNRLDKRVRVWPYALLQFGRCGAFAFVVPVIPVAVPAIGASVMQKWLPYFVYRLADRTGATSPGNAATHDAWDMPLHSIRLLLFIILAAIMGLQPGLRGLFGWQALVILGFFVFKARGELRAIAKDASVLRRHAP